MVRAADRAATLAAMQAWVAEYDHLPTRREWEVATPGRPSTRTIDRRWGWQELIAEASSRRLDAVLSENVHVGIGPRDDPAELFPGDAPSANCRFEAKPTRGPMARSTSVGPLWREGVGIGSST
jgi:hypothetical protein